MSPQFWVGLAVLPVGYVAVLGVLWVTAVVWSRVERWALHVRPRPVRDVPSFDVATQRTVIRLSRRADLVAAVAAAPRLWLWRALPGWVVLVARDRADAHPAPEVRRAIANALADLTIPDETED